MLPLTFRPSINNTIFPFTLRGNRTLDRIELAEAITSSEGIGEVKAIPASLKDFGAGENEVYVPATTDEPHWNPQ